jgi:hypothetical protein
VTDLATPVTDLATPVTETFTPVKIRISSIFYTKTKEHTHISKLLTH